ncbi:hypothetical protein LSAT2_013387 [Lamellibrachia satsuma]|nr:hypothetical protein LSAT2_013387 [Lamellibrachia satsuma]
MFPRLPVDLDESLESGLANIDTSIRIAVRSKKHEQWRFIRRSASSIHSRGVKPCSVDLLSYVAASGKIVSVTETEKPALTSLRQPKTLGLPAMAAAVGTVYDTA